MDFITLLLVLFFLSWTWFHFLRSKRSTKLPPGPYPFPIIGNILQLGQNPHQSLAKLSKTYGPLMSLKFGSVYTVVASSPEMAKEILQKHDQIFSFRTIPGAAKAHDHHKVSMGYLPVGTEGRKYRKICREKMFSTICLDESNGLRQAKIRKLCDYVHKCSVDGRAVNIGEAAFITTLNLMSATLFSTDFTDFDSDETQKWKDCIEGLIKIVAVPNFADYFPVLKPFDPQGIKRKADFYFGELPMLIEGIINQRLEERRTSNIGSPKRKDMLETLLDLSEGTEYDLSCNEIKHFLLNFSWQYEIGIKREEMDTKERLGISVRKEVPLKAIPVKM
ncbi:hypothetical protein BUALT_Bualt07G0114700 [Buddleja alternifolia]|uniref:Cytochrome P450 n=1 Tax=Buddleja alternifolia TaxID=168488 RepID=A0AAV6XEE7_9LAMI|nr:hypothetical protein BUALT_Bualt07G0114700 [Buddleja alternifolia]